MKSAGVELTWVMDRLLQCAQDLLGIRPDAFPLTALRGLAEQEWAQGSSREALAQRFAEPPSALLKELRQRVIVGETFFFRQPEHFRFLSEHARALFSQGKKVLRAWSAGCASGEETYSLAATLLQEQKLFPEARVEVLGTDVNPDFLAIARRAFYGRWSLRPTGNLCAPLFDAASAGEDQRVHPEVRKCVTFVEHSLLQPLPFELGVFDVVLCRNVLIYFLPSAVEVMTHHLAEALRPEGLLITGPVDLSRTPPGLEKVEDAKLEIYRKASVVALGPPPPVASLPRPAEKAAPAVPAPSDPIALHLAALGRLERGDGNGALELLTLSRSRYPDYLPGTLELALFHARRGARRIAEPLMREVSQRARELEAAELIPGPEPLPARYYLASACAYLGAPLDS